MLLNLFLLGHPARYDSPVKFPASSLSLPRALQ